MPKLKLTTKLTLAVSLISTFIVIITGIALSVFYYFLSERDIKNYIIDQSRNIISEQIVFNQDQLMYRPGPNGEALSTRLRNQELSALIFDNQFRPIGTYGVFNSFTSQENATFAESFSLPDLLSSGRSSFFHLNTPDNRTYEAYALPITSGDQSVGLMLLAKETPLVRRIIFLNLTLLAFILPLAALVNSLVVSWLMRRSLLPLNRLISHIQRSSPHQIPKKIDLPDSAADEITQLATTFNNLLDQIQQSVSRQKDFIAHASHELKTPLTAAASSLDLALTHTSPDSPSFSYISQIKANIFSLNKVINNLLTLSRISESPASHLQVSPYLIKDELNQIASPHEKAATSKSLQFTGHIDQTATVALPPEHLQIIVSNLLDNAVKFTPPPGQVSLITRLWPKHIDITVADTGPGMTPQEAEHIFDRFYRGRTTANIAGSGLGMAIVKLVCDLHHLPITVESNPGQGTQITVRLPLASAPPAAP